MSEILARRIKQRHFRTPAHESIINIFVTASHLRRRFDQQCGKFGITFRQYNILRILRGQYPNGYARNEIMDRMLEPAADVTRILDRLEADGLVQRKTASEDRRVSLAYATEKSLNVLDLLEEGIALIELEVMNAIGISGCTKLSKLCEELYGMGNTVSSVRVDPVQQPVTDSLLDDQLGVL
ncbi:MAG TPA: MarR family transcriptional regulator [Rhodothermales bacterium]|nr:MarR family transcriptional regulator [Rhodothermales bacterium]